MRQIDVEHLDFGEDFLADINNALQGHLAVYALLGDAFLSSETKKEPQGRQ